MRHRGAFHLEGVGAGVVDDLGDLRRRIDEVVAGRDDADDVRDAHGRERLVGEGQQTVVGVEFLDGLLLGAGLPLADESHVGVEVAQRATKHHVVDVQMSIEIACDAGEDHGVRLVRVDEMLRGGGDIDGAHATNRCRNVDARALVGFDSAARHADASFLRYGDVA